ncbi:MAG: hypothetical protein HOO06_12655 [Bdellovibrionaceae bacterium]|jgi:hypothetical protein|nr:hypothetical protein [Pseudobdellovibrionaceae bacterium]
MIIKSIRITHILQRASKALFTIPLLSAVLSHAPIYAGSPLTSISFYKAYTKMGSSSDALNFFIKQTKKNKGFLSEAAFDFITDEKVPVAQRMALINYTLKSANGIFKYTDYLGQSMVHEALSFNTQNFRNHIENRLDMFFPTVILEGHDYDEIVDYTIEDKMKEVKEAAKALVERYNYFDGSPADKKYFANSLLALGYLQAISQFEFPAKGLTLILAAEIIMPKSLTLQFVKAQINTEFLLGGDADLLESVKTDHGLRDLLGLTQMDLFEFEVKQELFSKENSMSTQSKEVRWAEIFNTFYELRTTDTGVYNEDLSKAAQNKFFKYAVDYQEDYLKVNKQDGQDKISKTPLLWPQASSKTCRSFFTKKSKPSATILKFPKLK